MNIRKYYSEVSDEQEIPKVGNIGYYAINYLLEENYRKDALGGKKLILDVDITSRESIYNSLSPFCILQTSTTHGLWPFLGHAISIILPGIWYSSYEHKIIPRRQHNELFSALKDNSKFTQFRKDNNYPESSLSLNDRHRPLTYKDLFFLEKLIIEVPNTVESRRNVFQKNFYLNESSGRITRRLYPAHNDVFFSISL